MTNEEAIKRLKKVQGEFNEIWIDYGGNNEAFEKAYQALQKEERPQGEWIKKVDNVGFISHICSECGAEIEVEDPCDNKFCFNCGAPMGGKNGLSLQKNDRNS